jgi:hypothetical protein
VRNSCFFYLESHNSLHFDWVPCVQALLETGRSLYMPGLCPSYATVCSSHPEGGMYATAAVLHSFAKNLACMTELSARVL